MVRPKKHLGQHFLTDPGIGRRIVEALRVSPGDTVIEIGPGTGVLTEHLLRMDIKLIPVEIDPESSHHLSERWPRLSSTLVEGDFLKLDFKKITSAPFHVIGNLPYNISSQIFFRILEYKEQIPSLVCMIQKEVASRIASPPGSREYGILSVLLQAYYNIDYLFTVKPGSFFPPPKVSSGVIRLTRNKMSVLPCDENLFFQVVKTVFNQRRKMIRNSIKAILLNLESDFELLSKRPEQLGIPEFIELTHWVESQLMESKRHEQRTDT